jgi:hypothetical protein
MIYSPSGKVAMVTAVKSDMREMAATILARMIVRAYLGEIDRGEAGPNAYREVRVGSRTIRPPDGSNKLSNDTEPCT